MSNETKKDSTTIMITNEGMGKGDPQLQKKLVSNYLKLVIENDVLPSAICFYSEGVKLIVDGSPVLDELRTLEEKGVWLIVCRTCLNHYDIMDKVQVGIVGGMTDIIEAQRSAEKVITL